MKSSFINYMSRVLWVFIIGFLLSTFLIAQELKSSPQGNDFLKLNGTFEIPSATNLQKSPAISMILADLDGDGIKELITGRENGVSIQMGDINAFAPKNQESWEAIRDLRFISPFKKESQFIELPIRPENILSGDFNRDSKMDIIAAARGGNSIYLIEGNGSGGFRDVREIQLAGRITSLVSGDVNRLDGLTDVIVGLDSNGVFSITVFQGFGDIFNAEPERLNLTAPATQILIGQFDENTFADIAVASSDELMVFSGHDKDSEQLEPRKISQGVEIKGIAAGDFIPDRDNRSEFALLGADGFIRILSRGDLDTRPVTKQELMGIEAYEKQQKGMIIPQRILKQISLSDIKEKPESNSDDAVTWNQADLFVGTAISEAGSGNALLSSARLSNRAGDDLILMNQANDSLIVMPLVINDDGEEGVRTSYTGKRSPVKFILQGTPLAISVDNLNFDSNKDLIILEEGKSTPTTLMSAPQATFVVNSNGDQPDANPGNGVCATAGAVCTLRAAIMEANRLGGADSITINSGIGTITINTGFPDDDSLGTNDHSSGDLDISCTLTAGQDCVTPLSTNISGLTITGAVGGSVVSGGTFAVDPNGAPGTNSDRIFDVGMDGIFGGGFGGSVQMNVTMSNLTIQNGNVRQNFNMGTGSGNFARGGAFRYDGFGQSGTRGTLTLTSVTVNNNQADHDTGGIFNQFASISISSSTISNNIGKAGPGGGMAFLASTPATLSVSNATFSGNQAQNGFVFATQATDVDGGGFTAGLDNNTATVTNTNFTNNISFDDGGAVRFFGGAATVTGGTMSGNTSRDDGGAVWGDNDTVSAGRFLTLSGVTIQGNTANSDSSGGGDGGAVFRDRGTLNVNNSTIGGLLGGQPNNALNGGGIAHAFRAAVTPSNVATINIDGGTITANNATTDGGGVYINATNQAVGNPSVLSVGSTTTVGVTENNSNVHGGGFAISGNVTANITRASIHGNDADKDNNATGDGGGMFHNNASGSLTIPATVAIGQSGQPNTGENGGAIHHSNGTLNVTGVVVANNTTDVHAGGLFVSGGTANINNVTFSANASTNGTEVRLTGGTTNFSNTITIPGELSIAGGTLAAGSSIVNLGEDFHFSSGTFTAGTSSFNFNGTGNQQIYGGAVPTFNNLTDSNTAQMLAINNNINANGNLTVNANATLNPAAASVIGGTGTLTGSGTSRVTRTAATADFSSQYTITNKNLTNLLVDYVGTSAQVISALTYGGLRLNNASGATLASGTTTVGGTLFLTNGNLAVSTNTLVVNNGITVGSGTFSSAATGTFNYNQSSNGQVVLAGNYGNLTFSNFNKVLPVTTVGIAGTFTPGSAVGHTVTGSNINFNGTSAQTVPVFPYEGLTIANAAGASLGGNVTVNGALGLASGVLAVGTNTLTLNSTVTATAGSLSSGVTGTVNYNQGSNGQTVLPANYGNLTFSNFNKTLPSSTVGIAGTFTTGSATGHTITGNTINFNGAGAQTIPAFQYNNLTSSSIGGRTLANSGTIGVLAIFTPGTNAYTVTGSTIDFNGAGAQTIPASLYNNLTTSNGGVKTTSGAVNVNGNATVGTGTTLVVAATSIFTVAGTLTNNSTIQGLGTIANNFNNGGILAPGLSPGILNITGNYTNTGSYNVEIGGTGGAGVNPNGHDQLLISGTATMGGTLNVTFTNGFTPVAGNSFVILDAASLTGTFATTNLPDVSPNQINVIYNNAAGTVTLNVVAPVAAAVSISGRVLSSEREGIAKAIVLITDFNGVTRSVSTNSFGYYRIDDVQVGSTYTLAIKAKDYRFAPRLVKVADDISDLDFIAEPK